MNKDRIGDNSSIDTSLKLCDKFKNYIEQVQKVSVEWDPVQKVKKLRM